MKLEEAAFINLVVLARADGLVSSSETDLIRSYRSALGVSQRFSEKTLGEEALKAIDPKKIKGSAAEKDHVLRMMIRVAFVDGRVSRREKRLLRRIAFSIGVGKVEFADLFVEIGQDLGLRRKLRRSQIGAIAAVAVVLIASYPVYRLFSSKTEKELVAAHLNLDKLKKQLVLERAQAVEAIRKVTRTQESLTTEETSLSNRLKDLENQTSSQQEGRDALLHTELNRLRKELSRVKNRNTVFKEIEKEYGASILLIFTRYELVSGIARVTRGSMGSGFFVFSVGHIVTNKHVVQPWKFDADDVQMIATGYSVDPKTVLIAAWPAGATIKTPKDFLDLSTAYSTMQKTLSLEKHTTDTFEEGLGRLQSGGFIRGRFHTLDNSDLAVLKAAAKNSVKAIPLGEKVEKLDPVMVLGFPSGLNLLETAKAETSPSLGEVRKVQTSIMVTAPIVPGNSGGPLMDMHSNAVGVASKSFGEATLGSCIPIRHALPLLPEAAALMKEVSKREADGKYRAALDDLHLAEKRCADDKERKKIIEVRNRLFAIRDRLLKKAEKETDKEKKKKAYQEIADRFGRRWAKTETASQE